jgi:hypothetical protein
VGWTTVVQATVIFFYIHGLTSCGAKTFNLKFARKPVMFPFEPTRFRLWSLGTETALNLYYKKRRKYYEMCVKFYVLVDVYLQHNDSRNGIKQTESNKCSVDRKAFVVLM